MATRLKRIGAMFLVACGVYYAGMAGASDDAPQPDPPIGNETTPIASATAQKEHIGLPSRFTGANVHPSEDQVDTSEIAQSLPVGPQYRMSDHVTLGGSLVEPDISDPKAGRYVFGLRITF